MYLILVSSKLIVLLVNPDSSKCVCIQVIEIRLFPLQIEKMDVKWREAVKPFALMSIVLNEAVLKNSDFPHLKCKHL